MPAVKVELTSFLGTRSNTKESGLPRGDSPLVCNVHLSSFGTDEASSPDGRQQARWSMRLFPLGSWHAAAKDEASVALQALD